MSLFIAERIRPEDLCDATVVIGGDDGWEDPAWLNYVAIADAKLNAELTVRLEAALERDGVAGRVMLYDAPEVYSAVKSWHGAEVLPDDYYGVYEGVIGDFWRDHDDEWIARALASREVAPW